MGEFGVRDWDTLSIEKAGTCVEAIYNCKLRFLGHHSESNFSSLSRPRAALVNITDEELNAKVKRQRQRQQSDEDEERKTPDEKVTNSLYSRKRIQL